MHNEHREGERMERKLFPLQRMVTIKRNKEGNLYYMQKSGKGLSYSGNMYRPLGALLIEFPLYVFPYYIFTEFIPWLKCRFFNKHTPWSPSTEGYISCYICSKWLGWDEERLEHFLHNNKEKAEYKQRYEKDYFLNGGYVD